jgi:hypothetical protein
MSAFCIIVPGFPADHTVTVNYNTVLFTNDTFYHGVNFVAFWDAAEGSAGSREALRRAGIHFIRFPGGEPGNWYDWAKATTWTKTTTDSLWKYAKAVGAKLVLQTNPTSNNVNDAKETNDPSAAHVAAWVDYCKTGGVDAPLWEIGNEPEGFGGTWAQNDWDSTKLKWYFNKFNEQAPAMKLKQPSIKVLGPVSANTWYWWGIHELPMFLKFCDAKADAISLHWYPYGSQYPGWDNVKSLAQGWQACMDFVRTCTGKPVYITEWAAHADNPGGIKTTMALALASADIIGAFAKSGVAGHCWFGDMHHYLGWSFLYGPGEPKPLDTPLPCYYILPLWTKMGNQVLSLASTADSANVLSAYSHKKKNGSVQVMLINKSASLSVDVKFNGYDPAGKTVSVYELKGSGGGVWDTSIVYNGSPNPNASVADLPAPASAVYASAAYTRTLAPYSITVLDFGAPSSVSAGGRGVQAAGGRRNVIRKIVAGSLREAGTMISSASVIYDLKGRRIDKKGWGGREAAVHGIYLIKEQ